jgi:hypothetical protein
MQDPTLRRLIAALDGLIDGNAQALACDIDEANLRMRRLARFGVLAENSPYTAFIRRVLDDKRHAAMAASA